MARPAPQDSSEFYHGYIDHAKGNSVAEVMANHSVQLKEFYNNLPEEKADYAYASGKWTIKEVLQHVIDAERVFSYRALRFARKDSTPLPSFDENSFAQNSNAANRTLRSLKGEFNAVRNSTDLMIASFNEEQLNARGIASNKSITVNALTFIIYGHLLHHKAILEERYLK
ncbi:MAG TPA: DinB family protein [Chitinophagaceae bacterium]|nr:DinB family protein [Chitinophagaceae bacterium]